VSAPLGEARASRPIPRRSPVKFRLLFASNPLPMWVYDLETLAFLEVNDAAVAKYGYSAAEFLSMRITDVRPPEDVAAVLANVAVQRSTLQQSGRWRHRLKGGDVIDVEIVSHSLRFAGRPAALVVARDVTARLRAEADLAESEARKRAMLDAALDAIVAIDHEGQITEFNPAAERMFGWAREDVIGRQIAETIIPPGLRDRHRQGIGRYLTTGESTILGRRLQLSAVHADGREFPVELTVHRVAYPGPPTFSAFIRDLTESRRLEEQLLQAQKMESVGRLAGGIAHDFNNLLTAISGYAQLALDDPDAPPRVGAYLEQVLTAAARAAELTGQLLAFSRRQVMQPIALHLGAELEDITPMLHRLLREDVEIVTTIDPGVGHVLTDPGQLTQVILNLVVNARDAMPTGGTVTVEARNADLDAEYAQGHADVVPGPYVMLSVTDTGVGMDEATRARLFEPFFTTKEQGKGTGLGLATVYGIVKQSGGHIWVYSEPDHGSVFKVYLPMVEATSGERLEPLEAPASSRGTETILVVEDDTGVRGFVRAVLEAQGYRVLFAAKPSEALDVAGEHEGQIRLLLTDVVMPGMSGVELARRLTDLEPGLKVLFVSGYTENTIVHHGVLNPGVSFLPKPFSADALALRVRQELDS
jgi:two-component system cell cycle sensor histidine kinase/response regulator CckA